MDVICILWHEEQGTYHVAFFEESPIPGPIAPPDETTCVRLKVKLSRTVGRATMEEALADVDELAKQIRLRPENVWRDNCYPWDGGSPVWVMPNWTTQVAT